MSDLNFYVGLHPLGAAAVVVSTVLLYFAFAAIIGWSGQRLFASPSSFDLAIVTVLGAIVGRAILGQVPTLSGALLALATLFTLEALTGRVRRSERIRSRQRERATAVMVAGRPDRQAMHRHHLDDVALWAALRAAGVHDPHDVALVVLEQTGRFSVLRRGEPLHPAVLTGVRHSDQVRARLVAAGLT
ncbi:hypothetical protein GCM10009623_17710 [Nocardioides aestuarii]|uniref:DUF421 domain-containing protein n=1 Tax=Nocardioides aestuarii TaxID=252231 RepID=A0ABW4TN78_9ACTN